MRIRSWLFIVACFWFGSVPARVQAEAPAPQAAPKEPAPQAAPKEPAAKEAAVPLAPTCPVSKERLRQVRVSWVFAVPSLPPRKVPEKPSADDKPVVQLRQGIGVGVEQLGTLLEHELCSNKKIVLFLDGRPLKDLTPYPQSDPDKNILYFELKRTEESRPVWTYLLGKPRFTLREVEVSVGLQDGYAVPGTRGKTPIIRLDVIPTFWLWVWAAVVLFLLGGGLLLGKYSDMLRDSGPPPAPGIKKAYSLARVQLATWSFLVLASYLFIGLITGDYTTSITESVLGLMGISAGTAIGSSIIDNNPSVKPAPAAAPPAAGAPAPGAPVPPPVPGPQVRPALPTSGRWWRDILADEEGVNFHRFQMAAWTLVLGIVFLRQVYNELAMPDFNPTLLALIGISSGTYLGLKITTEKPPVR